MDLDTRHRVRDRVAATLATMRAIPYPVPPRLVDGWDGDVLDAGALYRAYNRLPRDLQDVAAPGFHMCMTVLTGQQCEARDAYIARHKLIVDVLLAAGLTYDDVFPDAADAPAAPTRRRHLALVEDVAPDGDTDRARDDGDGDDAGGEAMDEYSLEALKRAVDAAAIEWFRSALAEQPGQHPVEASDTAQDVDAAPDADAADEPAADEAARPIDEAEPADAAPMTADGLGLRPRRWRSWALASVVVAACMATLVWHRLAGPVPSPDSETARAFPIHRSVHLDDDMTVLVCRGERIDADTADVHIHVVNTSAEDRSATVSAATPDHPPAPPIGSAPPEPSTVVPARSTRHRVIRVPARSGEQAVLRVETRWPDTESVYVVIP